MKFYYSKFVQKWIFHLIPSLHLYIETHSPLEHKRLFNDGLSGLFLSFQWGKWLFTIGLCKKLKNG